MCDLCDCSTGFWHNSYGLYVYSVVNLEASIADQTSSLDYLAVVLRGVGITNPRTQSIINGCLTMWNMGFAFWGAYVIDKFGRRPMMLTSLSGMLCALIGWTVASALYTTHGTTAAGIAVIPLIFIFTASYSTVWNGILTGYTVEVMSYDIRSKLICTQNLLVQATITGFNYLNPVALENISWKFVTIFVFRCRIYANRLPDTM